MSRPKIRHLAMVAQDAKAVAEYYQSVFEMELVRHSKIGNYFLSDGYLNLAIFQQRVDGSSPCGLNHFGFQVESRDEITRRIEALGMAAPKPRDATYAELGAADPGGVRLDISEHGFQEPSEADVNFIDKKVMVR
jgi:catechol 2,3-dioxygenase-like lactoylglutathione lyase family enzyme